MVSCDKLDRGCQGGILLFAWLSLTNTGIPTEECVPYVSMDGDSGTCPTTCADGSDIVFYKA